MSNGTGWKEIYLNEEGKSEDGSKEKEEVYFDRIAEQTKEEVMHFAADNKMPMRGNHAKILAGFTDARFIVSPNLPADLKFGMFIPGKEYKAIARFSNGSGRVIDNDANPDLRGVAIKIITEQGDHDFLMTNAEPHHAKDAREAMVTIMSGVEKDIISNKLPDNFPLSDEIAGMAGALPYLIKHLGLKTGWHIAQALKKQMNREVESLATETYWSRSVLAIGKVPDPQQSVAVKYRLEPVILKSAEPLKQNDLGKELQTRLESQDIQFHFQVQRFMNDTDTPIEDAGIPWPSPFETIAELIIPQNTQVNNTGVDGVTFNPWNINLSCFLPIGSMNRCRNKVYQASASLRLVFKAG